MYIKVSFLGGFYGASPIGGTRDKHEWPPSPWRLYNALVCGHYTRLRAGYADEGQREALLALEKLPPPTIYAARNYFKNELLNNYVPVDSEEVTEVLGTKKQVRLFPAVHPTSKDVYFYWKSGVLEPLRDVMNFCSVLGTSRSKAFFEIGDVLPNLENMAVYYPDKYGEHTLPIYFDGTLEELDINYENSSLASPDTQNYEQFCFSSNLFDSIRWFRIAGPWKPLLSETNLIADRVRARLLRLCEECSVCPNAIIAKDDRANPRPHLSYIPLPFACHPNADGDIRGIAISIPKGLCSKEMREIKIVLNRLGSFLYHDQNWQLERVKGSDDLPFTLKKSTWAGPSKIWTTVTPMELQWKSQDFWTEYLSKQCQEMGLPAIENIVYSDFNIQKFSGALPAKRFASRYAQKQALPKRVHAKIEFKEDIHGPLVLGKGRYFGMGLFQPFERLGEMESIELARKTQNPGR